MKGSLSFQIPLVFFPYKKKTLSQKDKKRIITQFDFQSQKNSGHDIINQIQLGRKNALEEKKQNF